MTTNNPIRVAIAEDNSFALKVIVEKLAHIKDVSVSLIAMNGIELLKEIGGAGRTDLVLMDIEMPLMDGIEATRRIRKHYPGIKVVMLTIFDDDEKIMEAIQAGADGYILKEEKGAKIAMCIFETMGGGAGMSAGIAGRVLRMLKEGKSSPQQPVALAEPLTKREVEILEQLRQGLSYERVGENLFISYGTVRKHVENVYRKLQVHNKVEAIQKAVDNRLI